MGACCFGIGWGVGGLCPGPAIMLLTVFTVPVHVIWFGFLFIGMYIARKIEHYLNDKEKDEKELEKEKKKKEQDGEQNTDKKVLEIELRGTKESMNKPNTET